jgi:predicted DNA binding CopG/RHH family protein
MDKLLARVLDAHAGRLNIRLSSKDLEAIQKRALAEGLPYQTWIASLLHKYATGRLKEV